MCDQGDCDCGDVAVCRCSACQQSWPEDEGTYKDDKFFCFYCLTDSDRVLPQHVIAEHLEYLQDAYDENDEEALQIELVIDILNALLDFGVPIELIQDGVDSRARLITARAGVISTGPQMTGPGHPHPASAAPPPSA